MSIFVALLVGLAVGVVARALLPGGSPHALIVSLLLGLAGSGLAALIGQALARYRPHQHAVFGVAVLGAIAVVAIAGLALSVRDSQR